MNILYIKDSLLTYTAEHTLKCLNWPKLNSHDLNSLPLTFGTCSWKQTENKQKSLNQNQSAWNKRSSQRPTWKNWAVTCIWKCVVFPALIRQCTSYCTVIFQNPFAGLFHNCLFLWSELLDCPHNESVASLTECMKP